jgi:DNA-binding response OmpR family regulator
MSVRILFVDDEPAILLAFEAFLMINPGYEIDLAEDLDSAVSMLTTRHYDAVVTDLRLSSHDRSAGLKVIELTRRTQPEAKVMLLTGYGSPEVEAQAFALGADRCVQKPIPLFELEAMLRSLLMLSPLDE